MKQRGWKSLTSCFSILAVVAFCACAGPTIPPIKTYEQAKVEVEKGPALVDPPIEERQNLPAGKSKPIKAGDAAEHSGILLDEQKAAYLAAIKAERDRTRTELEAARKKEAIQKIIYESTVEHLKVKAESKNTWWEQNKGLVGFAIGTTVGMAIVTGLLYALTRGQGAATTTTNTHVLPMR